MIPHQSHHELATASTYQFPTDGFDSQSLSESEDMSSILNPPSPAPSTSTSIPHAPQQSHVPLVVPSSTIISAPTVAAPSAFLPTSTLSSSTASAFTSASSGSAFTSSNPNKRLRSESGAARPTSYSTDNHDLSDHNAKLELELSLRGNLLLQQQRRIVQLEEELQKAWEEIKGLREQIGEMDQERKSVGQTGSAGKPQSRYWTPEEHQRFLEAVEKFGSKDVKAIAQYVGTRNATQVRTHAQKYYLRIHKESGVGGVVMTSPTSASSSSASLGTSVAPSSSGPSSKNYYSSSTSSSSSSSSAPTTPSNQSQPDLFASSSSSAATSALIQRIVGSLSHSVAAASPSNGTPSSSLFASSSQLGQLSNIITPIPISASATSPFSARSVSPSLPATALISGAGLDPSHFTAPDAATSPSSIPLPDELSPESAAGVDPGLAHLTQILHSINSLHKGGEHLAQ
eukprot:GILI01010696.1.p1 GENE.GILI01010696.1~~GILI01010696.1.p1  ORF type:complete len:458 (+),score=119.27 GILI01010696.1:170-1543(+)